LKGNRIIGNTSKSGGQDSLLNKAYRIDGELVKNVEVLEWQILRTCQGICQMPEFLEG
jgi:hypothetical protein